MRMEKIAMAMVRNHSDHNAAVHRLSNSKSKLVFHKMISQNCQFFVNLTASNQTSVIHRPMVVRTVIVFEVLA
jgi:hypothetical protein